MLQWGQTAETMSTSREISCAQPPLAVPGGEPPVWPTLVKQGLPFEHDSGGSPNSARYTATADAALGSLYAPTIATVGAALNAAAEADSSPYALSRSQGS